MDDVVTTVNELVVPPDEQTRVLLSSTEHSALMLSTFAVLSELDKARHWKKNCGEYIHSHQVGLNFEKVSLGTRKAASELRNFQDCSGVRRGMHACSMQPCAHVMTAVTTQELCTDELTLL